ncbi:MAG: putative Ig domain-containing protein, partial [Candidatus Zixiibacteriota bacterium]
GTATFNWTPTFTQSGTYNLTFRATDGSLVDTEIVTITVNEAGNQFPVLATIGPRNGTEGVNLNFGVSATDPDGSSPQLTATPLPAGATFNDNGNGTGTFNWTPTFTQSGSYNVKFVATDGVLRDSEFVSITIVESGNQAPVLAAIGARSITEGALLTFGISATDPDGTTPNFTTSTLPAGATFINNGNGTGSFSWTPTFVQAGSYPVTFRATDGTLTDTEVVVITVNEAGNQRPVLAVIGAKSVTEGNNLTFNTSATDADGTTPIMSAVNLPSGASFINNGNGTGTFNWTPNFTQSGPYNVTFISSDGTLADSELVTISVNEAGNQPPILAPIGFRSTTEGVNLNFIISATDADGTTPTLTSSTLPSGATFVNNGNGTGTFNWTPNFTQSGTYNVTFRASDGVAIDTEVVQITVNEVGNQAPILAIIGAKSVLEGVNLNFNISATDADGTTPS